MISQRLPFKFKAPRMVVDKTPAYDTMDQIILAWDNARIELKAVLEKFQDNQMKRKIYTPCCGHAQYPQALRFFESTSPIIHRR
ncbi:MAG: hypothetical protein IPJ20_04120 [Flammeovirgaceae bacterium]|nr:hypothetical protein [Flammeovirgaceae bacterium]